MSVKSAAAAVRERRFHLCVRCGEGRGSALEQEWLYPTLARMGIKFWPQVYCLGRPYGAADAVLLLPCVQTPVMVQADGKQHFGGTMFGTPTDVQVARDRSYNRAAAAHGYHVVRIHHADAQCIPQVLLQAGAAAARAEMGGMRVLWYSPSYPHAQPYYWMTSAHPLLTHG